MSFWWSLESWDLLSYLWSTPIYSPLSNNHKWRLIGIPWVWPLPRIQVTDSSYDRGGLRNTFKATAVDSALEWSRRHGIAMAAIQRFNGDQFWRIHGEHMDFCLLWLSRRAESLLKTTCRNLFWDVDLTFGGEPKITGGACGFSSVWKLFAQFINPHGILAIEPDPALF